MGQIRVNGTDTGLEADDFEQDAAAELTQSQIAQDKFQQNTQHNQRSQNSSSQSQPVLMQTEDGLALVGDGMELHGDFTRLLPRLKKNRLSQELLVKAARIKGVEHPFVVDATAGLGEDSLLLAGAGFKVLMCESDSVIAALLRDTLERAAKNQQLSDIVSRMELIEMDSIGVLTELSSAPRLSASEVSAVPVMTGSETNVLANLAAFEADMAPDVVYLDPMFPARTKSAAVKKKFQLLHYLEAPCSNQEELLEAALAVHPKKVVVKRPAKGPYLADKKPSYSITGKAVRFDVYVGAPST